MTASAAFQALTAQSVQQALSTKAFGRTLHLLEGTSSTNTVAMTLGQEGASHGTVVVAETQTAGRGRSGRQWYSRSEEHTSELQSRLHLVCRLLLEKKKKKTNLESEG